jgi:hypothetical protein
VQTRCSGAFWNSGFLETLAHQHINGCRNYVHEIDAVLTLDAVDRLLFRGLPSDPEQPAPPAISRTAPSNNTTLCTPLS